MARRTRDLQGFTADLRKFQTVIVPSTLVAFQKLLAFELYKRIMQKTPVDKGTLRGSWTVSIGTPSDENTGKQTSAADGQAMTASEQGHIDGALAQMAEMKLGNIVWINNSMPYVGVIEFDGHSSEKAPRGMVNISIGELKAWLRTQYGKFMKVGSL
jgi:hypothetical protein